MRSVPSYAPRHARTAQRWVARLASGECSQRELERLQAWLARDPRHRAAFERQRAVWQSLGTARELVLAARPDLLDPPAASARIGMRWIWRPAMAALAVVVLALWAGPSAWLLARADYRSGATPQSLVLDDGTRIWLDADSAIAMEQEGGGRGVALLRGRAWFEVTHDSARPFQVRARQGHIRDVGTAFEVELRQDAVYTAVAEGEVALATRTVAAPGVRLQAGQAAEYRRDGQVRRLARATADTIGAWRHGELLLTGVDGRAAITRIARYRNAPVWIMGDLGPTPITAVFRTDRADQAITSVASQLGLRVSRLPAGVLLVQPAKK